MQREKRVNMTYFDIESILAEEELVPCTTLFDFSHLGHLEDSSSSSGTARASSTETQYLKEGTKLKMPLWAMEKWASLRYVKVHLPRHLNQKARERWEADPLAVDLRCVHQLPCVKAFVDDGVSCTLRSHFTITLTPTLLVAC